MCEAVFVSTAVSAALAAGSALAAHERDTNAVGHVGREAYVAGMTSAEVLAEYDANDDGMLDNEKFADAVFVMHDEDHADRRGEDDVGAFDGSAIRTGSEASQ